MLPLKLVRSLVLKETILSSTATNYLYHRKTKNEDEDDGSDDDNDNGGGGKKKETRRRTKSDRKRQKSKTPLLFFLPTKDLIADTYRLATIARDMGMDLFPTPSLSHIIFSFPSPSSSSSPSPSSSAAPSSPTSSSSFSSSISPLSSSLSCSLPNHAVLLSFPSLSSSSLSHLRSFVSLSKGLFKLVFVSGEKPFKGFEFGDISNWDCCSVSLFSRVAGDRIDSMEEFSRVLAGNGWTLYNTKNNPDGGGGGGGNSVVYLFRKVYSGRFRVSGGNGDCRVRELRLPALDFSNAPLRILQYLVLMTDDVFFLA